MRPEAQNAKMAMEGNALSTEATLNQSYPHARSVVGHICDLQALLFACESVCAGLEKTITQKVCEVPTAQCGPEFLTHSTVRDLISCFENSNDLLSSMMLAW